MPPKKKNIPFDDAHTFGLKTLLKKGWNKDQMAEYYHVSSKTIGRRLKELEQEDHR